MSANIKETARVHGVAWAAAYYARRGVNIDTVLHALGMRRVGVAR